MDVQQNPYSIRRFLIEEKGALEDQVYLNILILDLQDDMDEAVVETLKSQMQRDGDFTESDSFGCNRHCAYTGTGV